VVWTWRVLSSRVGTGAGSLSHRAQREAEVSTAIVTVEIAETVVVMAEIEQHCDYESFDFRIQNDAAW